MKKHNLLALNEAGVYIQDIDGNPVDFVENIEVVDGGSGHNNSMVNVVFLFPKDIAEQRLVFVKHISTFRVTDSKGRFIPNEVTIKITNENKKIKVKAGYLLNARNVDQKIWKVI